jgi:hypothetical protein
VCILKKLYSQCVCYRNCIESIDHLYFEYSFTKWLWRKVIEENIPETVSIGIMHIKVYTEENNLMNHFL